jgi:hypothetical protein
LSIKVWTAGEDEPSWTDPVHVRVFEDTAGIGPTERGRDGIYAGHIEAGDWVEYGRLEIKSLDGSSSPRPARVGIASASQRRADREAALTRGAGAPLPAVGRARFP